jgi:hypothetical protein
MDVLRSITLKCFSVRYSWGSFATASAVYFVPTLILGTLAVLLLPPLSSPPTVLLPQGLLASIAETALLLPALETLLLIYPCSIAIQAVHSRGWAAVIGCAPIVLLHLTSGWQKPFIVAWPFYWSALCYFELSAQGHSLRRKYTFLFGMHALSNLLVVIAAAMPE